MSMAVLLLLTGLFCEVFSPTSEYFALDRLVVVTGVHCAMVIESRPGRSETLSTRLIRRPGCRTHPFFTIVMLHFFNFLIVETLQQFRHLRSGHPGRDLEPSRQLA